jgi:hypothetical protein
LRYAAPTAFAGLLNILAWALSRPMSYHAEFLHAVAEMAMALEGRKAGLERLFQDARLG